MTPRRVACLVLWLLAGVCLPVMAQQPPGADEAPATRAEILEREREAKRGRLEPQVVSAAEQRVLNFEKINFPQNVFVRGWHQFRPIIGGMPSGSGFVVGPGFINGLDRESFDLQANARISIRGFTTFDTLVNFPTQLSDAPVLGYARAEARNLTELRFFGLGPDSGAGNRLTYELQDRTFDTGFRGRATRFLGFGASGGYLAAHVRGGTGNRSIFEVFPPDLIPGAGDKTSYITFGGDVEIDLRDEVERRVGVVLRFDARRYDDITDDEFDFDHVVGEIQGHIPLGTRNRIFAVRVRSANSTGRNGGAVPFYLMETLGGGDTIRGFREYRFRDERNILINAEYRWEVWTYMDFTFFYDAGKVFSDAADLNFEDLETGYGFGIRTHVPGGFTLRMDVARSDEGVKFHFGGGPRF